MRISPLAFSLLVVCSVPPQRSTQPSDSAELELSFDRLTPENLRAEADRRLARGRSALEEILAVTAPRTIENTLQPYDDLTMGHNAGVFNFISIVHPEATVRSAATREFARMREFRRGLWRNPQLYRALAAIDARSADEETRYFLERELATFRENNIDRDEATARVLETLQAEIIELERQFNVNLRLRRPLAFNSVSELDGMPADWLQRQQREADGKIVVPQDFEPILRFANHPATRERATVHRFNVGMPANHETLGQLLSKRHELARLEGARTYAEYQFRDHMAGSPSDVTKFLDRIRTVYLPVMRQQHAGALRTLRTELPEVTALTWRDYMYAARRFRAEQNAVDVLQVREYFPYERVRDGLLKVTGDVFGVDFKRVPDAPVWHPSVEAYDVLEKGQRNGRLYLDVAVRDRPAPTASHPIRSGVRGKRIPVIAITGRFRNLTPDDPSLMDPQAVISFFHEMGHAVHHLFAVRRWGGTSGQAAQFDFREVPSNFFTEWARDAQVLGMFARHYKTGQPIPAAMLASFRGVGDGQNLFRLPISEWQARLALALHNDPRGPVDIDAVVRTTIEQWLPYPPPAAEIHPEASFQHLSGYGAGFYTYLWAEVIAEDMRTRFNKGLLDREAAAHYRRTILQGARSAPASKLIEQFLGRPFSFDAWARSVKAGG